MEDTTDEPTKPKGSATQAEIHLRVTVVFNLILAATPAPEIRKFIQDEWGVSSRQTTTYISRAKKMIENVAAGMRADAMSRHLAMRSSMLHKASKNGDGHLALKIAQDESKLLDLYPAVKREITGKGGGPIQTEQTPDDLGRLTDDELETLVMLYDKIRGENEPTD